MNELAEAPEVMPCAMQERIDDVLMANSGDARAAIESLLLYADAVSDSISFGYVRGRFREQNRQPSED